MRDRVQTPEGAHLYLWAGPTLRAPPPGSRQRRAQRPGAAASSWVTETVRQEPHLCSLSPEPLAGGNPVAPPPAPQDLILPARQPAPAAAAASPNPAGEEEKSPRSQEAEQQAGTRRPALTPLPRGRFPHPTSTGFKI